MGVKEQQLDFSDWEQRTVAARRTAEWKMDAAIIADCNEPPVLQSGKETKAKVSYGQRHLAKAAGFHWNSLVPQAWVRHLSTSQRERLPFPVELVDKVNG